MEISPDEAKKLCAQADTEYFDAIKALEAAGEKMNLGLRSIDERFYRTPDYILSYGLLLQKLGKYEQAEQALIENTRVACEHHTVDECCFAKFALGEFYVDRKMYEEAYESVQSDCRSEYGHLELMLYIEFCSHVGRNNVLDAQRSAEEIRELLGSENGEGLKESIARQLSLVK